MIRWAVTGPAGAGKSLFTAALARCGAAVVDGDALGHEILARPEIVAAVGREFGPEVVPDGKVDRRVLGGLVFADAAALARLDDLTHGPLGALAEERLTALEGAGTHALAVLEAAVYFRLPAPPPCDLVIVVDAPAATRVARLAARAGGDPEGARTRVASQAHLISLWRRADLRVVNDGEPAELSATARRLWRTRGPGANSQGERTP